MTEVRFHHVALSVPSLEESVEWYQEMLGFSVLSRMTIPHNGVNLVFLGNGEFIIEVLEVPGADPLPEGRSHPDSDNSTLGVKHFCIAVDDNVSFVQRLREKGVKVVFEPAGMPAYCAFINDPTGNIIEIFDTSFDVRAIQ